MRSALSVARGSRDVVAPDDPFAIKGRRKDRRIAGHGEFGERFARNARKRVQHVRLAFLVDDVVEERSELRARGLGSGVGYGLYDALEIEFTGNDGARPEQGFKQCLL